VLDKRRKAMEARGAAAWKPVKRDRVVSKALLALTMTTRAARPHALRIRFSSGCPRSIHSSISSL